MLPSNPTLVDIANRIADGQIAANYQFWIIFIVLGIIAALVLWFVAPYLGERGKLLAAAETLKTRLDEIRNTTAVAEQVRTSIARSDWTIKEYKTLKRIQLEHLLSTAFKLMLSSESDAKFQENEDSLQINSREFMIELRKTASLYFAELEAESKALIDAHASLAVWVIQSRTKIRTAKLTLEHERANQAALEQSTMLERITGDAQRERCKAAQDAYNTTRLTYVDEYSLYVHTLSSAVDQLQAEATKLMQELITPETHVPPPN
jgi:hypothetical protein